MTKQKILEKKNKNNEFINRKYKLQELKKQGFNFPNQFKKKHYFNEIYLKYNSKNRNELKNNTNKIQTAGRIIQKRIMGKAGFMRLQDSEGEIQIYAKKNSFTSIKNNFNKFKNLDLGDIIGIIGTIFKTRTHELTINCTKFILLTKALRSLPEKFHGLVDKNIRYRKRYLDFISNHNLKKNFQIRSQLISIIRNYMHKKKFLEVETPMLHNLPGGAIAKPFITHHNSLNKKMYLRIAPELYLKRLIVGGFEKIFEINRNFRNEGVSSRHNPEFTMMEIYLAYSNYKYLMKFLENLIKHLLKKIKKNYIIKYQKNTFNFKQPFSKLTMQESIVKFNNFIDPKDLKNFDQIKKIAKKLKLKIKNKWGIGKIITEIFEKTVEKKLIHPTFITEYPIEVSPLARQKNDKKNISDRFEFFIGGYEIGNGFSELNDPEEQKKRFKMQIEQKKFKENKKIKYDKDYILALEHGMPPTAGLGIGIDRLTMIFTNQKNIKDVIMFPNMRFIKK
ncbi:Lysine--tRNA ligase [Buchnera aphidicola (Chaitophorus populicola)]|uniref:lysine--tRNA ligase n=1 Tax=Buchnera aphidicola TaxID=9 RepID=UPI003464BEDB